MLNRQTVIGIEGTHGSGKTSLARALASFLGQEGRLVSIVEDQARLSPYVRSDSRGMRIGTTMLETAIAVARVNAELEAATADSILLCDRTVLAGLAYLTDIDPSDEPLAQDLRAFLVAYAERTYDIIVVVDRAFAPRHDRPRDPLLPEDRHAQAEYQVRIRILLESTSIPLLRVAEYEESWSTALRVAHELDARGLLT